MERKEKDVVEMITVLLFRKKYGGPFGKGWVAIWQIEHS